MFLRDEPFSSRRQRNKLVDLTDRQTFTFLFFFIVSLIALPYSIKRMTSVFPLHSSHHDDDGDDPGRSIYGRRRSKHLLIE